LGDAGLLVALGRGDGGVFVELESGRVDGDGGPFADGFTGRLPHQVARRSSMSFSASFWVGILGILASSSYESSNMRDWASLPMGISSACPAWSLRCLRSIGARGSSKSAEKRGERRMLIRRQRLRAVESWAALVRALEEMLA